MGYENFIGKFLKVKKTDDKLVFGILISASDDELILDSNNGKLFIIPKKSILDVEVSDYNGNTTS